MRPICTVYILNGCLKANPHCRFVQHFGLNQLRIRTYCAPANKQPDSKLQAQNPVVSPLERWQAAGRTIGRNTMKSVSATAKNWWDRYEEFVGLVEVRDAQGKVTEAERDFMVARGIVRESRENVEAQQIKLKEVRDRLDRVSREDIQYLELATLEHKLLQEEKRLRALYVNAEESEREKFSLFSASVRASHEKERTRAERTKNWSIIGSVLGALIGVMGSTYINRIRLQELKSLLLEAQKGPVSLQEAIHEHASVHKGQQKDLGELIATLRNMVPSASQLSQEPQAKPGSAIRLDPVLNAVREHMAYSQETGKHLASIQQKFGSLENSINRISTDLQNVKSRVSTPPAERILSSAVRENDGQGDNLQGVMIELAEAEQRLGSHINRNSLYSTAVTCTVVALTLPVLYVLLKGN
ncbi:hypothetical protein XENTR_v10012868 [Xenopus tropicalis]|uniref:Coiled-coil domain-containing protein 51 n=1 Tax=Xenopus tropicalis TaxID=8364 RepID=F7DNE0_XENTR|nr:mitochondrial potassium channel [Xenopus tropicalis]XP_012816087.1 mitochondrial potassium channel isoform X3 [Xenopus tropicalis]XP_012816088.1 mitochondrial potassium channel isoform X3 [Xenopus tropicalis]AAI61470.1 LOC100145697 protein [Xenopus tropicalis]KAE8612466.1 hypothetical protein XENTR_v10012868 [Xenopus tropicalis]|eukprot:XP_012816087.1 PREDICTED: coiled-coil domain-containing protein 51 isoform X3 [Xenopus tropicalis]